MNDTRKITKDRKQNITVDIELETTDEVLIIKVGGRVHHVLSLKP